jgi:beta-aspartyl-peptidase (threonine type)
MPEAAVVALEDNPLFNAGTGSTLNSLGQVEMDAAIMEGRRCAPARWRRSKELKPIAGAPRHGGRTPSSFAGVGALLFAREIGFRSAIPRR